MCVILNVSLHVRLLLRHAAARVLHGFHSLRRDRILPPTRYLLPGHLLPLKTTVADILSTWLGFGVMVSGED